MTQLNRPDMKTITNQHTLGDNQDKRSGKIQMAGAFVGILIFTALLTLGSCSREKSKPGRNAASNQSAVSSTPTAPTMATAATPAALPIPMTKKTKKRRSSTFSYVNKSYGVSFSLPRQYTLKTGDKAHTSGADADEFDMNFVQTGGLALAAVQLPEHSYPGTDFKSGLLKVNVNSNITSEACSQFAFPDTRAVSGNETSGHQQIDKITIGAQEFTKIENSSLSTMKQSDAKYYHVFNNGTCYEFALGLGRESNRNVEGVTPVDREAVFSKLEKILATVKFEAPVFSETRALTPSAGIAAAADSSKNTGNRANDQHH